MYRPFQVVRSHLWPVILLCIGYLFIVSCGSQPNHEPQISDTVASLETYLTDHYQSPHDYIVSKFAAHDVVFIGERHRLRHDVALVRELIPQLHETGVYCLGTEFARHVDQPLIDSLITGATYDEQLARKIQFNQWPWWGFQDYIDIYRAAWEVNRTRPEGTPVFRVVGLNARSDWSHVRAVEDRENSEVMAKVWPDGDGDAYMAEVVKREFFDANQKALVYCGCNHAYTRYHQPVYDFEHDELVRLNYGRVGNRVFEEYGERCFNICLHAPWPSTEGYGKSVLPADGLIDSLIARLPDSLECAGFDVVGTPFGELTGRTSLWQYGYPEFTLADYCDGYIIQGPVTEYQGVAVAAGFINERNRLAAILQSANPTTKDTSRTVADCMASLANDTEIQRIFSLTLEDYDKLTY